RQPAATYDSNVSIETVKETLAIGAEDTALARVVAPGADHHADRPVGRKGAGDATAVGNHGQIPQLGGQAPGEVQGRGTGIDHQDLAPLDGLGGERADALALLDEFLVALVEGWFRPERPGRGAPIRAAQHALLAEFVQIAPDGF